MSHDGTLGMVTPPLAFALQDFDFRFDLNSYPER
jgi:hypothetical protein